MPDVLSETVGTSVGEIFTLMVTLSETVGASTLVGIAMPEPPSETDGTSVTERLETSMTESLMDGTSAGAEKSFLVITLSNGVGASLTESVVIRCLSITDGISVL